MEYNLPKISYGKGREVTLWLPLFEFSSANDITRAVRRLSKRELEIYFKKIFEQRKARGGKSYYIVSKKREIVINSPTRTKTSRILR